MKMKLTMCIEYEGLYKHMELALDEIGMNPKTAVLCQKSNLSKVYYNTL